MLHTKSRSDHKGPGMLRNTKALARSKSIDQQIEEDRERRQKEIQLLILGGASSGKSTFIKQLRIHHGDGYPEAERKRHLGDIYENMADGVNVIIDNMRRLGIEYSDVENESFSLVIKKEFPRCRHYYLASATSPCEGATTTTLPEMDMLTLTAVPSSNGLQKPNRIDYSKLSQYLDRVRNFWEDAGVQRCFKCHEELEPRLVYAEKYFLQNIPRICEKNYVPTMQDVLAIRKPTIGVQEHSFTMDNLHYRVIDVAGQKSQRKKWIPFFEGVTAVIFFAAISGYCENLEEDSSLNSLQDSIATFEDVIKNKFLEKTDFILFLNKKDLFADYLRNHKLSLCFPEYTDDESPEAGIQFIKEEFTKRKPTSKEFYCHVTCAIDRELMKTVIDDVMQIIIGINLRHTSVPL